MYVIVVYQSGRSIAGYGSDEILVFIGTFVTLTGLYAGLLATNLFQLSNLVRDGSFDMLLVKPVSTQFLASFRRSEMGALLFDTLAGIIMILIGLFRIGAGFDIPGIVGMGIFHGVRRSCGLCALGLYQ